MTTESMKDPGMGKLKSGLLIALMSMVTITIQFAIIVWVVFSQGIPTLEVSLATFVALIACEILKEWGIRQVLPKRGKRDKTD